MFTYDLAVPGPAPASIIDAVTLGVEVTDPIAARRCGLGNIDPQHAPCATTTAAAAVEACLDAVLPPVGARLVTTRPDLDSICAMALLTLRAEGLAMSVALQDRVRRIAAIDRFDRGAWPGPRPLPQSVDDILADGVGAEMAALAAAVSDRSVPMALRVKAAMAWLLTGEPPDSYAKAAVIRAETLFASLKSGATRLETRLNRRVALAISLDQGALGLGYRLAPVVLALNPAWTFPDGAQGRKYTLARWAEGDCDLDRVLAALEVLETGWGGQRGIKGSPQTRASGIPIEAVIAAMVSGLPNYRKDRT